MTLIPSHEVPPGSLVLSAMKEELSKAYLHLVASAAGLTVGEWKTDYDGVDASLKSHVDFDGGALQPKVDIQLKSTGRTDIDRTDTIAWSLETRTVGYLTNGRRSNPALFCVLVGPNEPGFWLALDREGLLARSHMYYIWGHEMPAAIETQETQTIHLPKANLIDAASLIQIMKEASKWQPRF